MGVVHPNSNFFFSCSYLRRACNPHLKCRNVSLVKLLCSKGAITTTEETSGPYSTSAVSFRALCRGAHVVVSGLCQARRWTRFCSLSLLSFTNKWFVLCRCQQAVQFNFHSSKPQSQDFCAESLKHCYLLKLSLWETRRCVLLSAFAIRDLCLCLLKSSSLIRSERSSMKKNPNSSPKSFLPS